MATLPSPTFERARDLSIRMTQWPSVTGSDGEAQFSENLAALLRDLPCFRAHPDDVLTIESHGAPKRANVIAVVRGKGRRAVVLAGHFDTVSIDNYGALAPLACDPERLRDALIAELSAKQNRSAIEDKTLADLAGGTFLPGRGLLDMKSGLAAGIVALERFAALEDRVGTLIFVATPDEENRSRGMIALRDALPGIAEQFDVEIVGGINLDATSDDDDSGRTGQAVYLGSVGKFSPFAYVIGRQTHAGYAFDGVSAHLIAAELMLAVETNSDLCDEAHGEISPAPVCLEARDIRAGYEVTTPGRVWLSFNWLTHRRSAQDVLKEFTAIARGAMDAALSRQKANSERFFAAKGETAPTMPAGQSLTAADLAALIEARGGQAAKDRIAAIGQRVEAMDDPLTATRTVVEAMVAEAGIEGPAVITGFSTLHYPRVHVDQSGTAGLAFAKAVGAAAEETASAHGTTIATKQFFAGISDMSFFGHRPGTGDTALLSANTPCAAFADKPPETSLSFPVVNIGPWGRDYHQKWERVHAPYTFGILPEIVLAAAIAGLAAED